MESCRLEVGQVMALTITVWELLRACVCVVQSQGSSLRLQQIRCLFVCRSCAPKANKARGDKLVMRGQQGVGLGLALSTPVAGVRDSDRASGPEPCAAPAAGPSLRTCCSTRARSTLPGPAPCTWWAAWPRSPAASSWARASAATTPTARCAATARGGCTFCQRFVSASCLFLTSFTRPAFLSHAL